MKFKTCYKYNSKNKIFEGKEKAFIDPMASKRQGKDVFALPSNCTFQVPLEKKQGNWIYYNEEKNRWDWMLAIENVIVYNKKTQEKTELSSFNKDPVNFTDKKPPSKFHTWDNEKEDWVYTKIKEHIQARIVEINRLVLEKKREVFTYKKYKLCIATDYWLIEGALASLHLSLEDMPYKPLIFFDKNKKKCSLKKEDLKELANVLLNRSVLVEMAGRELIEKLLKLENTKPSYETIKNFEIILKISL